MAVYLDSIDGFDWPDKVSVSGREVSLWYDDPYRSPRDSWEIDVEVDDALAAHRGSQGWTVLYRENGTGKVTNRVRLPITTPDPTPESDDM